MQDSFLILNNFFVAVALVQGVSQEELRGVSDALKRVEGRKKRKSLALAAASLVIIAIIAIVLLFFLPQPQLPVEPCSNGVKDAGEGGIDCGGNCVAKCPEPVLAYVDPAYILPTSASDVAVDSGSGLIYVLDEMRHRIMLYDSEFNHIKNFGETRVQAPGGGWNYESGGTTNDKLLFPASIYAANGKVYVLDRVPRVQVFSKMLEYEKTLQFSAVALEALGDIEDPPNSDAGMSSIVVSDSGNIYIADQLSNAIAAFDSEFRLINAVKAKHFDYSPDLPGQMAFGPSGSLFVADQMNGRILVFDQQLNFVKSFDSNMLMPTGVAVSSDGRLFVLDRGDGKLKAFDSAGNFVKAVGGSGGLQFYNPAAVKLDSEGNVYIIEQGNARVTVLDKGLKLVKLIEGIKSAFAASFMPFHIAISPNGDTAVSDPVNSKVFVFGSDFKLKKTIGGIGPGRDELNRPKGVAFDSAGKLFISDYGNRRIQVFSSDYSFLKSITNADLIWPFVLSVSDEGKLFVIDAKDSRLLVFDKAGKLAGKIGEEKGVKLPAAVLAKGGKIYVLDESDKTIKVFNSSLNEVQSISGFDAALGTDVVLGESLAIDGKNRLLSCDTKNRDIVAYDLSTGKFSSFGDFGPALLEETLLEVAASSKLIAVADMEQHRVLFFDLDGKELEEITINDLG